MLSDERACSIISYSLFITYILTYLYNNPLYFIKYFSIIFGSLVTINGTILIEFIEDEFLPELMCYSKYVGSLPLYILAWWLLLVTMKYVDKTFSNRITTNETTNNKTCSFITIIINIITFFAFLGLFLQVYDRPSFLLGIDRFTYSELFPLSPIWDKINRVPTLLLIFPLIWFIYRKSILASLSILLYIMYFLWTGYKFGPFFNLLFIGLLLYYNKLKSFDVKRLRRFIKYTFYLLSLLILLTFTIAYNNGSDMSRYVWNRPSQQGQLWWKTYELTQGDTHIYEFKDEYLAIVASLSGEKELLGTNHGIYKIMYLCAPEHLVDRKLDSGSRYTEAGFASVYYYFGYLGIMAFSIFTGLLISITVNCLLSSISKNSYVSAAIILRLFMHERVFLSMFIIEDFFKPISLLSYIYLYLTWNKSLSFKLKNGKE